MNDIPLGSSPVKAEKTPIPTTEFVDRGAQLPQAYGQTYIVLMPRDPYWLFSYWEITENTIRDIKSNFGEDIFVRSQAIIRMNEVVEDPDQGYKIVRTIDVPIQLDAKNWYLRSDRHALSWCVEIGIKTPDGRFIVIARSNIVTLPAAQVSDQVDEKWVSIKDDLEKILLASGGGKVSGGSLEIARLLSQRWKLLEELSHGMGSGSVSSFSKGQQGQQPGLNKGFWLVADCELILYGATEPNASVTVTDKPVQLLPDGTFSLRFALPDGPLDLPIKAVSGDRTEERRIKISVERKTQNV